MCTAGRAAIIAPVIGLVTWILHYMYTGNTYSDPSYLARRLYPSYVQIKGPGTKLFSSPAFLTVCLSVCPTFCLSDRKSASQTDCLSDILNNFHFETLAEKLHIDILTF